MSGKLKWSLATLVILGSIGFFASDAFIRKTIVEQLDHPVTVRGWKTEGLLLDNGLAVPLPEFVELPVKSAALSEATSQGIEIRDGRVLGLVRVHHWCGNDPIRKHVIRIDLSHLLMFVNEGKHRRPNINLLDGKPIVIVPQGGTFTKWGWRVGEYYTFRDWLKYTGLSSAKR